jgi:hypothetical protein
MAGRLLSDRDHETLRRTVEQVQRSQTNLRSRLANYGVRRHQGGYKPASAAGVGLYYRISRGVKGHANTDESPRLTSPSNTTAWLGAKYVVGSESDVGISFDSSEADPDTNGNFPISTTGVYRVAMCGQFRVFRGASAIEAVELSLYQKPSGGAIAKHENDGGDAQILEFEQSVDVANGSINHSFHIQNYGFFTAGDRLALAITMSFTSASNSLRDILFYMTVERLQDTAQTYTAF